MQPREDGGVTPDPALVLEQLRAPGLAGLVHQPQLLEPWRWNLGDVEQLVYALTFDHPHAA